MLRRALRKGLLFALGAMLAPAGAPQAAGIPAIGTAQLDELSLEELMDVEVVFGASRYTQKTAVAPAPVTILTAEDLRAYGYRTLADVLQSLRGFYTTYDRTYHYVGTRGYGPPGDYNTRVLLLIDGHRANDAVYDQANVGTDFPLDLDLIERIEVIRGPSSSVYGANAFFAVINVITRDAADHEGLHLGGEWGSLGTYRLPGSLAGRTRDGWEYLLAGSRSGSAGQRRLFFSEFDDPATNDGVAEGVDGEGATRALARLGRGGLTLQALWADREKELPTGSYGTVFNDERNRIRDTRAYVDLAGRAQAGPETEVCGHVYYDAYDFAGDYVFDYSEIEAPHVVLNSDRAAGRWWGAGTQLARRWAARHQLIVGAEFEDRFRQEQRNHDEEVYLDARQAEWSAGLYLQNEFVLQEDLRLTLGLREDWHADFDPRTSPRFAIVGSLDEQTHVKLLYGHAFRRPNAYELYYNDSTTMKPSPDLEPETAVTVEIQFERYFTPGLRGMLAAFRYETHDLIVQTMDPEDSLLVYRNQGALAASGVEIELEGQCPLGIRFLVDYAHQAPAFETPGEPVVNSPRHLANGRLHVPLAGDALAAAGRLQFVGPRYTLGGGRIDSYLLTHLIVTSRALAPGLEMSLGVYNLLDEHYRDPVSGEHPMDALAQDGRTVRFGFRYGF